MAQIGREGGEVTGDSPRSTPHCSSTRVVDGGGEEHGVSIQAGGVAQRDRDAFCRGREGEAEQVLDLRMADLPRPAPLEVLEGPEHGKRSGAAAAAATGPPVAPGHSESFRLPRRR
jgi:hypothetical protein